MHARVSGFLLKLRGLLNFSVKKTKLNMGSVFVFDTYVKISSKKDVRKAVCNKTKRKTKNEMVG